MAHFAEISNDIVTRVLVVHNNELLVDGVEVEQKGIDFLNNLLGGTWVQTSYNNRIRKQYAGTGYTYDSVADVFIVPQPYASWTLDSNHDWQPPTPKPEGSFIWDEESLSWLPVPELG
jgi:hypothetical protein